MNRLLRERREGAMLTQEELAERVGVSVISIRRWEGGQRPQPAYMRRLCDVLEATPTELGLSAERSEGRHSSEDGVEPLRVAFAVVVDGPHVLLVRRRDNGIWSWPAGMVKPGTNPAEVAVAETLAETGVHVSVRQLLGERLHPKLRARCSYWLCDRQGGRTANCDPREHLAVEWVLQQQLTDYIPRSDIFAPVLAALAEPATRDGRPGVPHQQATVVHAIIVQDHRVLMIRRAKRQGDLEWAFPAGQQEPGEDVEGTAIRETLEEVGLVVLPTENLGQRVHPYTGREMAYMACRVVGGTARVASREEVTEVHWADLATVRQRLQALGMYPPVAEYLERHIR